MLGVIDAPEYIAYMNKLGYLQKDIMYYLAGMQRLPTQADLKKWLLADLIDYSTWYQYMVRLKFTDEDIALYYSQIQREKVKPTAKVSR